MIKVKERNIFLIICITLISILELYYIYTINLEYKGIYEIGIFTILIIAQPFVFGLLLIKKNTISKFETLTIIILFILLPSIIYFTLPEYTYDDGKEIVELSLQQDRTFRFSDSSSGKYTIPVMDNPEQIFVSNREYYYIVDFADETKYFIVNPLTGELNELSKDYWSNPGTVKQTV